MANEVILNDGSSEQNLARLDNGSEGQVLKMISGSPAWANSSSSSKAFISFAFDGNTGVTSFGFVGQIVNINAFFNDKENSGDFTVTGNNQINNVSGRELKLEYSMNFCGRLTTGTGAKVKYSVKLNGSQEDEESEGVLINNLIDLVVINLSCTITIPIGGSVIFTVSNTTSTDPIIVQTVNGFLKEI